jgi:hypothetical protein
VPVDTAVSRPDDEPIVATLVFMLVHVPPPAASVSGVVAPAQADERPLIAESGLTVMGSVAVHDPIAYVIVGVPAATPVTMPVLPTVANSVELEDQVPPVGRSVSGMVWPAQTDEGPLIVPGVVFTVTSLVAEHPAALV